MCTIIGMAVPCSFSLVVSLCIISLVFAVVDDDLFCEACVFMAMLYIGAALVRAL